MFTPHLYAEDDTPMPAPFGATEPQHLLDWSAGGILNPRYADPGILPTLGELARLHLMDLLIAAEGTAKRRQRMVTARARLASWLWRPLDDEPSRVATDAGRLQHQIFGRIPEAMCLSLLVAAVVDGPFAPFRIQVAAEQSQEALQQLAADLGVPRTWADVAATAAEDTERTGETSPGATSTTPLPDTPSPAFEAGIRLLHAIALAKTRLRPATPVAEIPYLERLRGALQADLELHAIVDDRRSPASRDLKRKIRTTTTALKALEKEARK
ncbi:MAG TPA: hypothetical protein PKE40_08970 [Arachnia sp.]|nr:hypothetical protein [Arachnia sp.]HMT86469.1 hypothetical protein [Arachnia sp.]